jgi:hypothetical protein
MLNGSKKYVMPQKSVVPMKNLAASLKSWLTFCVRVDHFNLNRSATHDEKGFSHQKIFFFFDGCFSSPIDDNLLCFS